MSEKKRRTVTVNVVGLLLLLAVSWPVVYAQQK
jgi:hypothetical protein